MLFANAGVPNHALPRHSAALKPPAGEKSKLLVQTKPAAKNPAATMQAAPKNASRCQIVTNLALAAMALLGALTLSRYFFSAAPLGDTASASSGLAGHGQNITHTSVPMPALNQTMTTLASKVLDIAKDGLMSPLFEYLPPLLANFTTAAGKTVPTVASPIHPIPSLPLPTLENQPSGISGSMLKACAIAASLVVLAKMAGHKPKAANIPILESDIIPNPIQKINSPSMSVNGTPTGAEATPPPARKKKKNKKKPAAPIPADAFQQPRLAQTPALMPAGQIIVAAADTAAAKASLSEASLAEASFEEKTAEASFEEKTKVPASAKLAAPAKADTPPLAASSFMSSQGAFAPFNAAKEESKASDDSQEVKSALPPANLVEEEWDYCHSDQEDDEKEDEFVTLEASQSDADDEFEIVEADTCKGLANYSLVPAGAGSENGGLLGNVAALWGKASAAATTGLDAAVGYFKPYPFKPSADAKILASQKLLARRKMLNSSTIDLFFKRYLEGKVKFNLIREFYYQPLDRLTLKDIGNIILAKANDRAFDPSLPVCLPIVMKSGLVYHISALLIKDGVCEYYDAKGSSMEQLKSRPLKDDPNEACQQHLGDVFQLLARSFPFKHLVVHAERHQHDVHSCGVHVCRFFKIRLLDHQKNIDAKGAYAPIPTPSSSQLEAVRLAFLKDISPP